MPNGMPKLWAGKELNPTTAVEFRSGLRRWQWHKKLRPREMTAIKKRKQEEMGRSWNWERIYGCIYYHIFTLYSPLSAFVTVVFFAQRAATPN